jgi:predicted DNA-binding transcriptional regulator YafY
MSLNKNALMRYKILDNCFRNPGKRYFLEDLIEECDKVLFEINNKSNGISRRQVFDDIAFMESKEGWNIELLRLRYGKKVYYRYSNPEFSINNMPLNEIEINQLQSAANILSQFRGMPQFEWINEMLPKLNQGMSSKIESVIIMDFDSNQYLKGIENLGVLYNAIIYKKVLQISYQPFENERPFDIIIHPYFLKQYNNRWFLFGYSPEYDKPDWNLALDRIKKIEETKAKYKINNTINWSEYFEDIIGVTKTNAAIIEKIKLQFFGKTGNYIESKPIHGSQKSKWIDKNTLEVNLELIINFEFERLILSYAENVKVLSPKKLSTLIKKQFNRAIDLYK